MDDRPALHSRKPWLPLLVTLTLLVGLGGWVGWQWHVQETRSRAEQAQRFSLAVDDIENNLRERMRAYEMVLRGLAGLVAGSNEVDLDDWMRASDQLQLQDFYPGIQALALARHVNGDALPSLLERIADSGRRNFRVYPRGERDEYLLVDFIHPSDWRNRRVIGFDMLSEETRREAVMRARDSGNPVLTGPLRLRQETERDVQAGVLLFLPLYEANVPLNNEEERRQAFVGSLHGAFRLTDLIEGTLGFRSRLFQLQLFDAAVPDVPLLRGRAPIDENAKFLRTRNIYLYGRNWQLEVASTPQYEAVLRESGLTFSLLAAMSAAMLFSLLIGGYLYLRERALRSSQLLSAQLQEREARFRQLIEQLPVATLLCNAEGRIELANQSAASLLGSSAGLLAGERLGRYVPQMLDKGSPRRSLAEAVQEEMQAVREDGAQVPVSVSLTSFSRDDGLHHVLNLVDLQARKRDEERFRNVVEASPNAFLLLDSEGRMIMVNRQTERLFGYSRQELLGQRAELLIPEALFESRTESPEAPQSWRMGDNHELFGRHRDGHLLPVEVGLSPLRSGDEQLIQVVIIDIGHRKAAERRLREQADQLAIANRYKSEFLANMSHELRTPLNSILILSEQLQQNAAGNLSEKQVRHADIIHRAGQDLLQLINDVLDLARIETGHMQLKLEPLDVRELVQNVTAGLAPLAEQKGLALSTVINEQVPATLTSDRVRLQQILRNLLSNALKFTEQGKVELSVDCSLPTEDQGCEMLRIRVTDTGIGIAEDQHERIFQAFQQIDGSTSRQYGGTGLGLAITRQLVEVLGGRIEMRSEAGSGSCFTIELPVEPTRALETVVQAAPPQCGHGANLLIIEDDADFASVVAEVGQSHGFSSRICGSGQEGLQALGSERFAALILDILLPDISGWQVYRELRADKRHQDMPVFIISCVPQPHDWHEEGSRYLVKPVQQAELEQLFIDLARRDQSPMCLLLVEASPPRRQQLRDYFEQLGYRVTAASGSDDARLAFAEQPYNVLVIDFDLPGESGLDLLDALERLRPLHGVSVVINSRERLSEENLQRLRRYCAVALIKSEGMEPMGQAVKPDAARVAASWSGESGQPSLGRRVLLMDGDVRTIYSLTALFDELGLQVVPATSAGEAVQRFNEDAFDLALVDITQPQGDGRRLIGQLRDDYGCQVPIIALSGNTQPDDRDRCIEAGADDRLGKPVEREELTQLLRQWLGRETGRPQT